MTRHWEDQYEDSGDSSNPFSEWEKRFVYWEKLDDKFFKLLCDQSSKVPEVGDRVIVAAGFVGMGHPWVRLEAEVIELGEISVRVRFVDYKMYGQEVGTYQLWIHPALITDVLKRNSQNGD